MPYTAKDVNKILEKKVQTKRKAYTADDVNAILSSGKTGAQVIEEHNNARKAQRRAVTNANAAQSSQQYTPSYKSKRETVQKIPQLKKSEKKSSAGQIPYLTGESGQSPVSYAAKQQTKKTAEVQIPKLENLKRGSADTEALVKKALSSNYKMTSAEKKQLQKYSSEWLKDYNQKILSGEITQAQQVKDSTDKNSEYAKMIALKNKTNAVASFAAGLMSSAENLPGVKAFAKKANPDQYENLQETIQNAKTQNPFATGAGNMVGEMAKYQNANAIMSGIPAVQKAKDAVSGAVASIPFLSAGGNAVAAEVAGNQIPKLVGDSTANILSDLTLDTAFDTIPYLMDSKSNGDDAGDLAKKAVQRTGYNLGMNVAGEAIPYLVSGAGKAAKNMFKSSTDDVANTGREIADMSSSARSIENGVETAADGLKQGDSVANQIPELQYDFSQPQSASQIEKILTDSKAKREFQQQSGVVLEGTKAEQRRQVQEWLGMTEEERIASKISKEASSGKRITDPVEKAFFEGNVAETHTPEEISRMREYLQSVDQDILDYVDEVRAGNSKTKFYDLQPVSDRAADDIKRITGIDASGNRVVMDKDTITHIDKRHGVNGSADKSMADDLTLSRIQYILDNYDEVEAGKNTTKIRTQEGKKAPTVVFQKKIDGTYYVVEAATDAKSKKNVIVSAYTTTKPVVESTKIAAHPATNADLKSPLPTSKIEAEAAATSNIPMLGSNVNTSGTSRMEMEGDLPWTTPGTESTSIPMLGDTQKSSTRQVNPDGTYPSRTATNTLRNSELVKSVEGAMDDLEAGIKDGYYDIKPMTEKESIQQAADALDKDYAGELQRLSSQVWTNGSRDVDEGMIILEGKLKAAAESGNFDDARAWMRKVVEQGSEKGKGLQAYAKYSRTAEGSLVKAQNLIDKQVSRWEKTYVYDAQAAREFADNIVKEVDYLMESRKLDPMNPIGIEEIEKAVRNIISDNRIVNQIDDDTIEKISEMLMKGSTAKDIEKSVESFMAIGQYGISDETIEQVQNIFAEVAKYGENSKARVEMENKAYALLANEVTTSDWSDKWDAWRYFSMLSSPTTHIRNVLGNTAMNVVTNVKDTLGAAMESAVDAVSPNGIRRTKSILNPLSQSDKALLDAASTDAVEGVYRQLSGSKYGVTAGIESQSKAFRSKVGSKFQKLLDANSDLLEKEDWFGLKKKYRQSLASYLKANGADSGIFSATDDASKALLNRARAYAINQAQEATFHETSKLAQNLTEFSQNLKDSGGLAGEFAHAAIESVMPFKKTPVNILKQGIEYSPVGIVKGIASAAKSLKNGSKSASEVIEQMAKGLTGTGLLSLGAYLSSTGLLRGNGTGDADQDSFDELQGAQNYALQIGGKSYTLDWMAPSILPVLVGAELQKAFSNGSDSSDLLNALGGIADPIIETSFMTGVSNALDAVQYAEDGETLQTMGANMLMGYAQQGVPTALGKAARTIDNTRRSSLTDDTGLAGQIEYNANKVRGKIPFLSQDRPAYVDAWGRTQENLQGGNTLTNALYQFASPGYYSQKNTTPADEKLQELYDATGDASVLPAKISRSYDGQRLTAEQYEKAQTIAGQNAYDFISNITQTDSYDSLPDEDKAEAVNAMYGLAKAIALQETVGKEMSSTNQKLYKIYTEAGPDVMALYYMYKNVGKTDDASKSENLQTALNQSDLSRKEKRELYSYLNPGTTARNNPYTKTNEKISQSKDRISVEYEMGLSGSDAYRSMDIASRYDFDSKMDNFLNAYAEWNTTQKEMSSTNRKYQQIYENLGSDGLAQYYLYKKEADLDGNGSLKKKEVINYLNSQNMTNSDRRAWFSYLSKAKNPY